MSDPKKTCASFEGCRGTGAQADLTDSSSGAQSYCDCPAGVALAFREHAVTCDRGCGRTAVTTEGITSGPNSPRANVCDNRGCDLNMCEKLSPSGAPCELSHMHSPPCEGGDDAVTVRGPAILFERKAAP